MRIIPIFIITTIILSACVFRPQTADKPTEDWIEADNQDSTETDTFIQIDLTEYRDTIVGIFSGQGTDTLISEPTDTKGDRMNWKWQVRDSKSKLKPLIVLSTIRVKMVYEGDLDRNGTDEFGIRRENNAGTWDNYYIFTYENGKWKYLVEPIWTYSRHFYETLDMGRDVAEPINKKGKIRIRYTNADFNIIDTLLSIKITPIKRNAFGIFERNSFYRED